MEDKQINLPVDKFYESRDNFTIIGLTGLSGSGCSTLANYMQDEKFYLRKENCVRTPNDIPFKFNGSTSNNSQNEENDRINATSQLVFKRKYTICYDFVTSNYHNYSCIKYTKVIFLYTFLYLKGKCNNLEGFKEKFTNILADKYYPSKNSSLDVKFKKIMKYDKLDHIPLEDELNQLDWDSLYKEINSLKDNYIDYSVDSKDKEALAEIFFPEDSAFNIFTNTLTDKLYKKDYYCLCFLYHRLSVCIRNWGDPTKKSTINFEQINRKYDHLYDLIELVNILIKGFRHNKKLQDKAKGCRIVIDSIRNSVEALYLKERYTAFYLVAVHDDANHYQHLREKVENSFSSVKVEQDKHKDEIDAMTDCLEDLVDIETRSKEYEKGRFYTPNVSQCISDAEIHINNPENADPDKRDFYTMAEQWMKYAALILHPGLITPSSEERCMIVAYTAKFNSGCLSRQVGACITNQYHTIRTIGWNDVPYGQIPCALREIDDFIKDDPVKKCYYPFMYSNFEKSDFPFYENKKLSFAKKVDAEHFELKKLKAGLNGLPFSYCFKSLHNKYEGEKNQVFTRSLHAEENAMMQMVKYGGEPLMNGIIYVTASPCELCSKKLYQIGVRKIVYIDPYPGISMQHIIACGFKRPNLKLFQGAYGGTYFKLYQPFMSYKDEIGIRTEEYKRSYRTGNEMLKGILEELKIPVSSNFTEKQYNDIKEKVHNLVNKGEDKDNDNEKTVE